MKKQYQILFALAIGSFYNYSYGSYVKRTAQKTGPLLVRAAKVNMTESIRPSTTANHLFITESRSETNDDEIYNEIIDKIPKKLYEISNRLEYQEPSEYKSPDEHYRKIKCAQTIRNLRACVTKIKKADEIISSDVNIISKMANYVYTSYQENELLLIMYNIDKDCNEFYREIFDTKKIKVNEV